MTNYKASSDSIIFKARNAIKQLHGENVFDYIDQFPLFACPQTLLRYQYIQSLLESVLSIPGDICEFGTWRGATAVYLAKMLDELEPQSNRRIIVFDNFDGLPEPTASDGSNALKEVGNYRGDKNSLEQIIEAFDLSHRLELIEGDAIQTVPSYFSSNSHLLISLAYFDFDLYQPTIAAWNSIKNNISKGGVIVFDEGLDHELWPGEYKAAKEIIDQLQDSSMPFGLESNRLSRQPQLAIRFL